MLVLVNQIFAYHKDFWLDLDLVIVWCTVHQTNTEQCHVTVLQLAGSVFQKIITQAMLAKTVFFNPSTLLSTTDSTFGDQKIM